MKPANTVRVHGKSFAKSIYVTISQLICRQIKLFIYNFSEERQSELLVMITNIYVSKLRIIFINLSANRLRQSFVNCVLVYNFNYIVCNSRNSLVCFNQIISEIVVNRFLAKFKLLTKIFTIQFKVVILFLPYKVLNVFQQSLLCQVFFINQLLFRMLQITN